MAPVLARAAAQAATAATAAGGSAGKAFNPLVQRSVSQSVTCGCVCAD